MKERDQDLKKRAERWCRRGLSLLAALALAVGVGETHVATGHADDGGADSDANDWPMGNRDHTGSRYNSAESTIGAGNASGLKVKWQFNTPAPVAGTPAVVNDVVYAGDMSGMFYALNRNGQLLWSKQLAGQITASALVTDSTVVIGDLSGNVYGLNPSNGAVVWSFKPDPHPVAAIWGSATKIGKYVAIGVASNEETAAGNPSYPCCSTRGSVVLLDPQSGAVVWQTYTVSDADHNAGSSGASVWSSPAYDAASKVLYVTTGNNFSQPTTVMSDAIIAMDAQTGKILWYNQRTANDEWNFRFPALGDHPDFDFGDSPQIYHLPGGRKVVGAGQKSGFYHVVDATTGALVNQNQIEPGGSLGGLFADSAVANGTVFANGNNWAQPGVTAPVSGDLFALSGDGSQVLWQYSVPSSPTFGGVAVANSVVYFTASFSGRLFALSAASGTVLAAPLVGVSNGGPSISRGQVYVGTGDALRLAFGIISTAPGTITALGL